MKNKARLFKLREPEVRYLHKLMTEKELQYCKDYGSDFKTYLRSNDKTKDVELLKVVKEYFSVNHILQRCEEVISDYNEIEAENRKHLL